MPSNVLRVVWGYDYDAFGAPLALVIYTNRSFKRYYHDELGH